MHALASILLIAIWALAVHRALLGYRAFRARMRRRDNA